MFGLWLSEVSTEHGFIVLQFNVVMRVMQLFEVLRELVIRISTVHEYSWSDNSNISQNEQ